MLRNFQNALKTAAFAIDNANSPQQLVAHRGNTWIFIDNRGDYDDQTIITTKEMPQEVTADASSLSDEISKTGHVAVYGIHFDSGKESINQALSERRAQAVVVWLTAHGVEASRLSAKGMGQIKPIADNGGEEGRAKNRRVELGKQ